MWNVDGNLILIHCVSDDNDDDDDDDDLKFPYLCFI